MSKDPKLQAAIAFNSMLFRTQQKTLLDTHYYQRFLKVPSLLSISLRYTMIISLAVIGGQHIDPSIHWAIRCIAAFFWGIAILIGGVFIGTQAGIVATNARIDEWLKHKFNSHKKKHAWLKATDSMELEFAASIPDEAWEVDEENGGIKLLPGNEQYLTRFPFLQASK